MKIVYNKQFSELHETRIDLSLFKKRGNSKTYLGWILQRMKEARQQRNLDVYYILETCYKKKIEFEKIEKVIFKSWRGKSGVKFLESPDKVIAIRYKKSDIGEEAKEVRKILIKEEINKVILAINKSKEEKIPTSEIAESVYGKDWAKVFSSRGEHTILVEILNYLEYKGKTHYYRTGHTEILNQLKEIQNILEW